jgi:hypothetical protein
MDPPEESRAAMTEPSVSTSGFEQNLPAPILRTLRALARRIRHVLLLRGLMAVAATTLGTLLAMMALDVAFVMPSLAPRVLLTASGIGVVAAAAFAFLIWPQRRKISLAAISRTVELHHPELQERISSTVELRGGSEIAVADGDIPLPRGSEQLIAALADEATLDASRIVPRREVSTRSVRPYFLATLALALLLALVFCLWPREASLALRRVLHPFLNIENVPAVALEVTPGDCALAIGDPVDIQVSAPEGGLAGVELEVIDSTGYVSRQAGQVAAADNGRETASWHFPAVMSGFRYRVQAGRAISRYYEIMAFPRPEIVSASVRYEYPEYTWLTPKTVPELPRVIEALAGTQAAVTIVADTPVARPQWTVAGTTAAPIAGIDPKTSLPTYTWTFAVEPETSGTASLLLEGEHGIAGDSATCEIRATPDRRPTIAIMEPQTHKVRMRPRDRLAIKYRAEDDYGLAAVDMQIRIGPNEPITTAQPWPADAAKPLLSCRGETTLDLGQLDLGDASQLTVQMRAIDTLPESRHGPNIGESAVLIIEIDRSAEPPAADAEKRAEAEKSRREEEQRRQREELREKVSELAELAEKQEKLAEQAAEKAAQEKQESQPSEKQPTEKQSAEKHDAGQKTADQKTADQKTADQKTADQKTADQKNADQAAKQPSPKQPTERAMAHSPEVSWQNQQREIAEKLAEMIQRDPTAMREALKSQQKEANAMSQEARALAEKQQWLQRATQAASASPEAGQLKKDAVEKQMRELSQGQERTTAAVEALEKGDVPRALAQMQQAVHDRAESLHEKAEELTARAAAIGSATAMQDETAKATEELDKAARSAEEAQEAVAKRPSSANAPQQQAEQSLRQAADALARLGQNLAQEVDRLPRAEASPAPGLLSKPTTSPDASPRMPVAAALASAFNEATEAADSNTRQEAAEASREASRALAQAALAAAEKMEPGEDRPARPGSADASRAARAAQGRPSRSTQNASHDQNRRPASTPTASGPSGKVEKRPPQPNGKVEPIRPKSNSGTTDWVKFRGQMKRESDGRVDKDVDNEYRDLVNRYFEELSRQGNSAGGR